MRKSVLDASGRPSGCFEPDANAVGRILVPVFVLSSSGSVIFGTGCSGGGKRRSLGSENEGFEGIFVSCVPNNIAFRNFFFSLFLR